ncbi:MAG: hypothetical protein RDV48_01425 [Candidatus Eremiobacteraeota bacterium]|nr:hypothetical protein [Candidatus Eremiobacteraeota bacterium]
MVTSEKENVIARAEYIARNAKTTGEERTHPVIAAIVKDARTCPEKYVNDFKIPAEGE